MKRFCVFPGFNLVLILLFSISNSSLAQSPVVQTKYGSVEGYTEDGISIFKSIPFATPPVGNLRWRAPQPPAAWQGVKKCISFSASPVQSTPVPFSCWTEEFISPPEPLGEDCLYLNVWTGAKPNEKRPVFVWIYGGGFVSGSSACAIYDGKEFAKSGVVFVSINYRVGAFGFMAHPELTGEGNGSSGNYGMMDQVAALKWVKENISAFGGDPLNVTIAGQSAGSMSVYGIIFSPSSSGLFQKAIAHSGGIVGSFKLENLKSAEEAGISLQKMLGVKDLAAMRALPADSILHQSQKVSNFRYAPILDGRFLPADLNNALENGQFNQVDLLGGWVTGDGGLFGDQKMDKEAFTKYIQEHYPGKSPELLKLLPHETGEQISASMQKLTLVNFAVAGLYEFSRYNKKSTYIYEFSHIPTDKPGFPNYGAFHTSDVPYALHTLHLWKRPWKEVDYAVENAMSGYWLNFVKTGNPNGPGLPQWNRFSTKNILEIGDKVKELAEPYQELLMTLYQ